MCWYIGHRPKLWVRRSPGESNGRYYSLFKTSNEYRALCDWILIENNHKVITKANQRKEKYHKEPMETENKANCLKRGPRLKRWWPGRD